MKSSKTRYNLVKPGTPGCKNSSEMACFGCFLLLLSVGATESGGQESLGGFKVARTTFVQGRRDAIERSTRSWRECPAPLIHPCSLPRSPSVSISVCVCVFFHRDEALPCWFPATTIKSGVERSRRRQPLPILHSQSIVAFGNLTKTGRFVIVVAW